MAAAYKLTANPDLVIRLQDGVNIPRGHRWWPTDEELASAEPATSLQEAKETAKIRINDERDRLEATAFPYRDRWFDSDPRSVQRITSSALAAQSAKATNVPFEIDWAATDNSIVPLDADGVLGLPVALAAYAAGLHAVARTLREKIDQAESVEAVEAIAWPKEQP
ncbi:DUF4376 domain-containing protein [Neisseriaceae bacterium JH1-16]|nr:DUF4376 domain-containing protein [Neisseriaceae bacterium JH1-16]